MTTTNVNSDSSAVLENQTPKNQVATQSHYRRRNYDSVLYFYHLDLNHQNFFQNCKMDDQQVPSKKKDSDQEQEDRSVEKVSDPNRIHTDTEGHLPEDEKQPDPYKEIEEEENNYLVDEEGSIIKEPTREVDDPYRPGHDADKSSLSNEKKGSNPKENTETDF